MCPYAESSDRRCGERLTLQAIEYALKYCACEYRQCPVYRELNKQEQNARKQLAAG